MSDNSIYSAPQSDTTAPPSGSQMAAFVGPKFDEYYSHRFAQFDRGSSVSWNWPAFFISSMWFLYRKMWAYTFVHWFVLPITLAIIAAVISASAADAVGQLILFNAVYYTGYAIIGLVFIPMFANRLYYRHAKKKLAKVAARFESVEQQNLELARRGGTSSILIILLPLILVILIGVLAAISIPAYQDYTVRAQVSEGLNLSSGAKAAVTEFYSRTGELPEDNAEAGLERARSIYGSYVSTVSVDSGTITVSYGNNAHAILLGQTLELVPVERGNTLSWQCQSPSIAPKHLPSACR